MTDWNDQVQQEFERAKAARARGNEGQARVCARRAAGIAIREYYARQGQSLRTSSAYQLLTLFQSDPRIPPDLKRAAAHLTLRVTEAFEVPVDVDLLDEARKLCEALRGGTLS